MFDKLIESKPEGADFKNRRSYFMVSSLVVGVLFLTAVVISIYAADIGLGRDSFEIVEMIAPVNPAPDEPETPQPPAATSQSQNELPTRQTLIPRTDEPTIVPITTSAIPNTQMSRPYGAVILGTSDSDPVNPGNSGRETSGTGTVDGGITPASQVVETTPVPEPPPVRVPQIKKPPVQSIGVVNGRATLLPKPAYPATAVSMNIQGKVDVQVTIDETGKVISSRAVSGHPLLRGAAERSAWSAKFTPTLLSNVPVKVTGVIVYNFTK